MMKNNLLFILLFFGSTLIFGQDIKKLRQNNPQYEFPIILHDYSWHWKKNRWPVTLKSEPRLSGYIDNEGTVVIPFIYEYVGKFYGEIALVKYKGKYGYIDLLGKKVIDFKYDDASHFIYNTTKVALIEKRGKNKGALKWHEIDLKGKKVKKSEK